VTLKVSYTFLAPVYDLFVGPAFASARSRSLAALPDGGKMVLINGAGTGLDLPLAPPGNRYVGLDITRAMLVRAERRGARSDFFPVQGNSLALPFRSASFDYAVLHLILAVVPDGARALAETVRVVRPGGGILVLDKFLRPGQRAPLRRLLSPLAARIATRLDVVFEDLLQRVSGVRILCNEPAAARGWFRLIRLERL